MVHLDLFSTKVWDEMGKKALKGKIEALTVISLMYKQFQSLYPQHFLDSKLHPTKLFQTLLHSFPPSCLG